jgi:hypothetical protein
MTNQILSITQNASVLALANPKEFQPDAYGGP